MQCIRGGEASLQCAQIICVVDCWMVRKYREHQVKKHTMKLAWSRSSMHKNSIDTSIYGFGFHTTSVHRFSKQAISATCTCTFTHFMVEVGQDFTLGPD